jgi:hypothetical protein
MGEAHPGPLPLTFTKRRTLMRHTTAVFLMLLLLVGGTAVLTDAARNDDVPRITKEELKSLLEDPDVTVLDVRIQEQWEISDAKIRGAVHEDQAKTTTWASKYPKDTTLILY